MSPEISPLGMLAPWLVVASIFLVSVADDAEAVNYDESKVPHYTLPDPLVLSTGQRVTDAKTWLEKRRAEILELFRTHVYGRAPGRPKEMTFEVFDNEPRALGGKATRRQVEVRFTGKPDGPTMDLLIYLPNDATKPVPCFLLLNFACNHAINPDPGIRLAGHKIHPRPVPLFKKIEDAHVAELQARFAGKG